MRSNWRSITFRRALAALLVSGLGAAAQAQTTNAWTNTVSGSYWSTPGNWLILTNTGPDRWIGTNLFPSGVGAVVHVTNNVGDTAVFLTNHVTVGTLLWGDFDRSNQRDLRATNGSITFDNGTNGVMALFEHGTGDRVTGTYGNGSDDFDAPIVVADADGLFIDNWQTFNFHSAYNLDPTRAFNGGGHNVTKGEDGTLIFRGIVTNIATFTQRDGFVEIYADGDQRRVPGISNLVLGVASGVIDGGGSPAGTIVNVGETGAFDRIQFPYFSILGPNATNGLPATTNAMAITFNRGIFRSLARGVTDASNVAPAAYSGAVTLNGNANESFFLIEHQANAAQSSHLTTVVRQTVFTAPLTGSGGFTKVGTGEMTLTASNTFTGALNINRGFDQGRGRYGGIGLRDNGTLSGVSAITLNRDGELFLDNSAVNLSNRVNDAASITSRGRNQIELVGNGAAGSYERFGAVTTAQGSLAIEFDKIDASAKAQVLDIASLYRAPGSVIGFHASDLQQGVFASTGASNIVINLLDEGVSLAQVGGGGAAGATDRTLALGVFGGDGVDYVTNNMLGWMVTTPNRADEFMTVDAGRLRTLDPATEMVNLGGRVTNALLITQASANTDDNVNINFASTQIELGTTALTNRLAQVIDKRVVGDAVFNAIRLGIVRGTNPVIQAGLPTDAGRSMIISDGIRLTSESGMFLAGRDTGSTNGDLSPNGNVLIYGGTLDLDGVAGNREAILHNASGNSVFLRTTVEATNGLTKSGNESFYLDAANNLGGTVTIAQGSLYARDNNALRGATDVRSEGDGILILASGVTITNATLHAGERPYSNPALISESSHNVFGGDIMVENVDPQGTMHHDVRLRAGANTQNASLTLLGDIGVGESGGSPDINLTGSARVTFQESGGILNLKGVFGDRLVGGEAVPIDPTLAGQSRVDGGATFMTNRAANQNFVLRFLIEQNGGSNQGDEANVNIFNSWNAAGRIYAEQGTIRYLGNDGFWTSNALAVANFANDLSGFALGGGGTDQGGSVTFLLTKDGQAFNAERWTVRNENSANNTITMGLEHFGPSNATVTIGNNFEDPVDINIDDDRITISGNAGQDREFRLFAHDGYNAATGLATTGTVNVLQSIRGTADSIITKVGNGTVVLRGITNGLRDESNDIRQLMLLGGELVLDRGAAGHPGDVRRVSDNPVRTTLAGGDLIYLGANSRTTDELLSSNLTVRAGDSRVAIKSGTGNSTNTLFIASNVGSQIIRQRGGTVSFIEEQTSTTNIANIRFGATPANSRIGSWATYGTNVSGPAYTWAATDGASNLTGFTAFGVNAYGSGVHSDVTLGQAFASATNAASLRFSAGVGLDLGGNGLNVTDGGILITPNVTGAAGISNGFLTSSGGELIVHNYDGPGGSFNLGAAITGAVDVTFSGDNNGTALTGSNTYTGVTRINGGTVVIDSGTRFGAPTNLELRGGILATTANTYITNRTIVLGGDGGTFNVAVTTTNTIQEVVSEANLLNGTRQNNGHGDLIKTGAGVLQLGSTRLAISDVTASTNMMQGLVDVREGSLVVVATNNFGLGSSKSFYDGTIVRSGASLVFGVSAAASGERAASLVYPNVTQAYSIAEWIMLEQGSTLRINDPSTNTYQSQNFTGVIDFRGDATVFTQNDDTYFQNSGAGYMMGSGDLIKDGDGTLNISENSPDYTGDLIIRDGTLRLYGPRNNPLPNAGSITIGANDVTNRGGIGLVVFMDRDGIGAPVEVNQNITVQGFSDGTRIGGYSMQHNDVLDFNGDIDLANFATNGSTLEFRIVSEDTVESRAAGGADELREEQFINLNGDITGGNKRIRTVINQNYYSGLGYVQTMEPIPGVYPNGTNEMNMMVFFTMAGTNTGWTGSLEVGTRAGTDVVSAGPDQDKQHFMRFGRNDGAATLAIGASNQVVLRNDATLQAYGSQVTIGSLFSDGSEGGDGYFGSQGVSNTFLENGGTAAGSFTIVQASNSTFRGVIRDGTYYSPSTTNMASAALSIIKAGAGTLALDQSNRYSGVTIIAGGALRLNNTNALPGGISATGGTSALFLTNGGVLGLGIQDFYRDLGTAGSNVAWAGSGGFAAYGADRHVNIGGNAATQTLTWGQANFVSGDSELVFGASDSTHTLVLDNSILLTGTNRFRANNGFAAIDGRITGNIGETAPGIGYFVKTGDGILELTGSNTWSGGTEVSGGQLLFNGAFALPAGSLLTISNFGVVTLGTGDFTRSLGTGAGDVQWTGSGGFAANGANRIVNLGGATGQVTWGTGSFVPEIVDGSVLVLGATGATHTVDFQNPIALGESNRTVQVGDGNAAVDAILSGVLSGNGGLTKTGAGALALSNVNTFTGGTVLQEGTLLMGGDNRLSADSALSVRNGILNLGGFIQSNNLGVVSFLGGVTTNGTIINTGSDFDAQAGRVAAALTGTAGFMKTGTGTVFLSASNSYSGRTTVGGGILRLDGTNAIPGGILVSGGINGITLTNGGVIGLGATNFLRAAGTGASQIEWTGDGGFAAYNGDRTVNLGNNPGNTQFWGGGSFVPTGNRLILSAADSTNVTYFANPINLGEELRTIQANNGSQTEDARLSGVVSGAGGIIKTGLGMLRLEAVNTYTGRTIVTQGLLGISDENRLGTNTTFAHNQLTIDGATLYATASFTLDDPNRGIWLGPSNAIFQVPSGRTMTISSPISGPGGVTKIGSGGAFYLYGANTYTGRTVLIEDYLGITNEMGLGANPDTFVGDQLMFSNGGLRVVGGYNVVLDDPNRGITNASTAYFDVQTGASLTISNTFSGSGDRVLQKWGGGLLALNGTNTSNGTTDVRDGSLSIAREENLGINPASYSVSRLYLTNRTTLRATESFVINDPNRGVQIALSSNTATSSGGITFNIDSGATLNISNHITGNAGITKIGNGTLLLTNPTNFFGSGMSSNTATHWTTGQTVIARGTLGIVAEQSLGLVTNIVFGSVTNSFRPNALVISNGGVLRALSSFVIDDANRGILLGAGGGGIEVDASRVLAVSNNIAGAGGLTKLGLGTLILSNANTFTGGAAVDAGTMLLAGNNRLQAGGNITVNGGTLDLGGFNQDGSANVVFAGGLTTNGTITKTGSNFDGRGGTVAATLAGPAGLTKTTSNTLFLTGVNTYTGQTVIAGGTLGIGAESALGTDPVSLVADQLMISNGGTLRAVASFTIDDPNRGITLGLGGGGIEVDASRTLLVSNVIDGPGGMAKAGLGTLTLSGTAANTYTGLTAVGAGTLALNKAVGVNAVVGDGLSNKASADILVNGGTLLWLANHQLDDSVSVLLTTGGVMNINGKTDTIYDFKNFGGTYISTRGSKLTVVDPTWGGGSTNDIFGNDVYGNLEISGGLNTVHGDEGTALGAGSVEVDAGGLAFSGTDSPSLTLSADHTAAGSLVLSGDVSFSGSAGTASIASGPALLSDGVTVDGDQTNLKAGYIDLNGAVRTFNVADGSAATDMSISALITNAAGTPGGLAKAGAGTLLLTGNNAYDGPTTVAAGKLFINGDQALADGMVSVLSGATLGGNGTVGGPAHFAAGSTNSPGFFGAGIQTFASGVTYSNGATLMWELYANDTSVRGADFDGIDITGGELFVENGALMTLVFNGAGSAVDWSDALWASNRVWLVASLSGSATTNAATSEFDISQLFLDAQGDNLLGVYASADFWTYYEPASGNLYLQYAVPEPDSWILLAAGIGLVFWVGRRRGARNG